MCSKDRWMHFLLQNDNHICGVSVITMHIAALEEKSFRGLEGSVSDLGSDFSYLRNISIYNDFLCFVLIT